MDYIYHRVDLTLREREVLQLLAEGASNRAIANALTLAVSTVEQHNNHIFNKLGVDNRTAAVVLALRLGLIEEKIEDSPHDGERHNVYIY